METPLQYIPKEPGGPMETPFKLNLNRVEMEVSILLLAVASTVQFSFK